DVFGGGLGEKTGVNGGTSNVEAIVYGDVTVTLDGAKIVTSYNSETGSVTSGCIFGANNINGTPKGHVKVLVKNTAEVSGQAIDVASVFGGGSLATYVPSVANDYTEVEINKTAGNGSRVVVGNVYGGGNQAGIGQGSIITGTQVKLISGDVKSGLYGGSNKEGTVTGDATVTLTGGTVGANGAKANVHGGGYGEDTNVAGAVNVYVGTSSNSGNAVIYGDVYGGSALGKVNATATTSGTTTTYSHTAGKNTSVNLLGGTIHGDAYGGGLGQRQGFNGAESSIAALVYGNVTVTLNGTKFDVTTVSDGSNDVPASGRVFGCNNLFGSPMGTVLVYVASTSPLSGGGHTKSVYDANGNITTNNYEVQAVYGGGNLAAYEPTDPEANGQYSTNHTASEKPVQVVIDACGEASIEYVYGGGNAAPVPATDVLILGSYEIGNVFGGGNGKDKYYNGSQWNVNEGADVGIKGASHDALGKATGGTTYGSGEALATVLGGTIHSVFGASNTKGDIIKSAQVVLGDENLETCNFELDEIYGGGNEAYMSGSADIDMNCIEGLNQIYGGSKKADINGDVVLNITGGTYGKVFGGNNISGTIYGTITVNIEEKGCLPIKIGELYGGGNQAAYSVENIPSARKTSLGDNYVNYPQVNVISATEIGTIYGGGLGGSAVVTGNPHVNINMKQGSVNGEYVYKDGVSPTGYDAYTSAGTLPLGTIGTVFGGGNAAQVNGSTYVNIGDQTFVNENNQPVPSDAQITGNVFGGGNNAVVTGSTHVQIGPTPAP
ncbi:MAG: hypothetical protein J6W99_04515, partial [Bacteroidaceae bacterium]|nr:hypothetical protein [Bacteroidaceae bacterium]